MIAGQGVYEAFCHHRSRSDGLYQDICDGRLYQDRVSKGFITNGLTITFTMNTDGIPVFKSSGYSFWPIYLVINELPYHMR